VIKINGAPTRAIKQQTIPVIKYIQPIKIIVKIENVTISILEHNLPFILEKKSNSSKTTLTYMKEVAIIIAKERKTNKMGMIMHFKILKLVD
jgi:hypothetical protein